ncbi:cyclic nucleotide-binding domain-containing protein [Paenibacillus mesophilus]|uniref:peptidase domain-containing ABC transporter n=1 Tax=Paenibacillus mesophilus TaxID=2582849 RepID=UPI00110E072E|nr:peptidase domain-containing ABC transporter [Paenibacillus mesophilus]TMV48650.1 cyclic nucleotide-binding domain-containing protein [Paenibacillus mesophilus]
MDTNRQLGYLEHVPFSGVLSIGEKQMLSRHARILRFSIGQTILEKDDIPQYLYCVVSGEVRMIDERPDGTECSLGLLKDGDSFGWGGDAKRAGNPVAYSAAGNTRLLAVPVETLRELFSHNPGLGELLGTYMSSRAVMMFLRRTALIFSEDHQAVRKFLERMTVIQADKGQPIVRQGDEGDAFFIVHSGHCEVVKEEDGSVINRLIPGDFFGELALLTGARRKASVVAVEAAQLFRLSKSDFDAMIVEHPALRTAIESVASNYATHAAKYDDDDVMGELAAVSSEAVRWTEADWKRPARFRFYLRKYPIRLQQNEMDCGPACLAMVMAYYGSRMPIVRIREQTEMSRSGSTLYGLTETAESLGLAAQGFTTQLDTLSRMKLPAIAHWKGEHFIVVYEVTNTHVIVGDPAYGLDRKSRTEFESGWSGAVLTLTPTDRLASRERMRSPISRFIAYLTPNRYALLSLFVTSLLVQLTALAIPIFTQVIVDKVLVDRQSDLLRILLVGMLGLSVCYIVANSFRNFIAARIALKIDIDMLGDFYKHLLGLPLSFFLARTIGDLTSRVGENQKIRRMLTSGAVQLLLDSLTVLIYGTLMMVYHVKLSLIAFAILPCYAALVLLFSPLMRKNSRKQFEAEAESQTTMVEAIKLISTVKALAAEPAIRYKLMDKLQLSLKQRIKAIQLLVASETVADFIRTIGNALVLYAGAAFVMRGQLTVGQFVAFLSVYFTVAQSVAQMLQMLNDMMEVRVSMERIDDVFMAHPEEPEPQNMRRLAALKGHIRFDDVSFRYSKDGPDILRRIRLGIEPGQTVAIVGRSGAGKSTFANLLTKLFTPTNGTIRIDGHDIRHIHAASLRRKIGIVQQENRVFRASIQDNIAIRFPSATLEEVEAAAKLAGAYDFITALPLGFKTMIGEGGLSLSGGQLQRIAIARALLGEPGILIFDEATSALDSESERIIQQNMDAMLKGRTCLIIAHRLSTVQRADLIIVLDRGEIVETGSHAELIEANGLYSYLVSQQLS